MSRLPRGIRNHNPGNILRAGNAWRGLAPEQPDGEFCSFLAPEWGLRALILVLQAYRRRGITTLSRIITTYCPPVHRFPDGRQMNQDTAGYVRFVAQALGVRPEDAIDVTRRPVLRRLLPAIVQMENGMQPYPPETFEQAMDLAGIAKEGGA